MRVRKVDSDAIKLYESSQVKFKTTGTIREVQFSAGINKKAVRKGSSKADESTKDIGTSNIGKKVVKESEDHVKIKESVVKRKRK